MSDAVSFHTKADEKNFNSVKMLGDCSLMFRFCLSYQYKFQ